MVDDEANCKYCVRDKGEENVGDMGLMIDCGARATFVKSNAAETCPYFPMYDKRRSQDE